MVTLKILTIQLPYQISGGFLLHTPRYVEWSSQRSGPLIITLGIDLYLIPLYGRDNQKL